MPRQLLAIGLAVLLSSMAHAESILVEAESFVASHDSGGSSIVIVPCASASGGQAVDGFDHVGDWIEVVVSVSQVGAYADSLRSAGDTGRLSEIGATIFGGGPGGSDLSSTYDTVGFGIY